MRRLHRNQRGEGDLLTLWLVATLVVGLSAAVFFMAATKRRGEVSSSGGTGAEAGARVDITMAVRAAEAYYAEIGTYADYSPDVATERDPDVLYDASPISNPGVVSIRAATPNTVLFVTQTQDGEPVCAAIDGEAVSYGFVDATAPEECTGGWGT